MFCMFFPLKFASFLRYYICKKPLFSKAILWGPFFERKTNEAFCFAKRWSQLIHESPTTASLAQVAKALNGLDSSLLCPDAGSIRGGGGSNFFLFFCHSLSQHFSKPKISVYLRVFIVESPFLITWKGLGILNCGLGWIWLLAGIVASTFGV